MRTRFDGKGGRRLLVDALMSQRLVEHTAPIAERLADVGRLEEFAVGQVLISQNSTDNDVFFIVDGEAGILVNARKVATRGPGDSVGEMATIDGSARRSATVVAQKPLCALRVSEEEFCSIANEHPRVWRAIAQVVATRLRQRTQFHRAPNEIPSLFVGSSVEGLPVAKHIQLGLKHTSVVVKLWTNGVFGPGGVAIDALMDEVERCDFALFVFGPDDKVASRAAEYYAPRDNVVFELGLFMGKLDRDRCFIVCEQSSEAKVPSDLLGLTPLTYVLGPGGNLSTAVSTLCTEVEDIVGRMGAK